CVPCLPRWVQRGRAPPPRWFEPGWVPWLRFRGGKIWREATQSSPTSRWRSSSPTAHLKASTQPPSRELSSRELSRPLFLRSNHTLLLGFLDCAHHPFE